MRKRSASILLVLVVAVASWLAISAMTYVAPIPCVRSAPAANPGGPYATMGDCPSPGP